jgi:hypothetical protein
MKHVLRRQMRSGDHCQEGESEHFQIVAHQEDVCGARSYLPSLCGQEFTGSPRWESQGVNTFQREDLVEGSTEFGIAVMQQITRLPDAPRGLVDRVASYLHDPCFGWVPGDGGECDASVLQVQEDEDVVSRKAASAQHLDGEEISIAV